MGVQVRDLVLGEGIPKICTPITGATVEELLTQIAAVKATAANLVEWRVDYFAEVGSIAAVIQALPRLRSALGNLPLLFTFRTKREGGQRTLTSQDYLALNQAAVAAGGVDLVDVELFSGDDICREIIAAARIQRVAVVASSHDFEATPPHAELLDRLCRMHSLGADLPKLAVMPQSPADVLTLLAATDAFVSTHPHCPVITMSMGGMGCISRVAGELLGSALTFGSVGAGTAPGQLTVEELHHVLDILHRACL